jgi:hypothetical protein
MCVLAFELQHVLKRNMEGRTPVSDNFARPNTPQTTKLVDDAITSGYGSYEAMKESLSRALSLPSRSEETAQFEREAEPQTPIMPAASASVPQNCIRVIYPSGNSRFELYGDSEESLDIQEARIRALYQ